MKNKTVELNVDFIGGEETLTKDEEKQISEFIKSQKLLRDSKLIRKSRITHQKKTNNTQPKSFNLQSIKTNES